MSVENPSPETLATSPAQPARAATAGKVRWRRFAVLMIPSAAVAAVLVGPFTLVLRAGVGSTPVSADNLVVDADQLSGNATFTTAGTFTLPGLSLSFSRSGC